MKFRLLLTALMKFIMGFVFIGLLLFLPAGTFDYMNGWLFIGLLFGPMLILGAILFIKAPDLLEKRLNAKEEEDTQKGVVAISGLLFLLEFIVAGLDYRFGWSQIPSWLIIVASVVFLISYVLYVEVVRENAYLSRTIEVQENQKVVDTGLYGIVRHPMYAVTLWLFLATPIILGSWWALVCFSPYIIVMVVRIRNEEKVLADGLEGYSDYMKRVKYRIMPLIW
jgi:protein-S-isoprenylcysteine O-methyltransferase Ste14